MNVWLCVAAINGALAVIAGAFAAHGLKAQLPPEALEVFKTGAQYHLTHALAMGLAALAIRGEAVRRAQLATLLFLIGIVLFSGSLYELALTGTRWIGIITPFGGVAFIAGWGALAAASLKLKA